MDGKQFESSDKERQAYAELSAVVRRLRQDCPWDREQTHDSVKHLLIEEAYEAVAAIDTQDWDELREELGDLLLHVLFHSAIAEERGRFAISDVIEQETKKLVRRHPHVFGDVDVANVDEVLRNWEMIKMEEGRKESVLEGVPRHLPALLRAYRVQQKAAGVGFDFPERSGAWGKVVEEMHEFEQLASSDATSEEQEREFGDLIFALVNFARLSGINPENALSRTNDAFVRRFGHIETKLAESGRSVREATLAEMDAFWNEAKELEEERDSS